ncbi:MAG: sensor histidine kinase [Caloramator sp.]|nr:sensor histidine kinase [Caloramator sp.]
MKEFISILKSFFVRNIINIISAFIIFGIFLIIFLLYSLPLEPLLYALLLIFTFIFIITSLSFIKFYKKHMLLEKLTKSIVVSDFMLPYSKDLIEKDYQELIKIIEKNRIDVINEKDRAFADMLEYYTIWVHQIKTPIAAMKLILQAENTYINGELLDQLFKVEQYVDMVLQYLRMENMSSDLMFKRCSLDEIIKQAVRKYSKSFIRKKIKLNYESLNCNVLTDEKWLTFVIEQILSNALKYTNEGEISIYMDKNLPCTLVIEDTGIGIEQEDLPRVFEKGFTGYNGRINKFSTGIGLYLCKQILSKMSHTIKIESTVGKGTKVKIGLDTSNVVME